MSSIRETKLVRPQRTGDQWSPLRRRGIRRRLCTPNVGKAPWFHLPEKSKSITDLAKPMSFYCSGGEGCACPTQAKPRGSIFTNDRKVLLFSIREAKHAGLTQQQPTTQTSPMPTHRKVRSAIPTRFILRLPSPCSRALSAAGRIEIGS